jgi:hypothetical protein
MFTPFLAANAFILVQLRIINNTLFGIGLRGKSRTQKSRAGNQNVIVGNIGAVYTDVQSANAVNT